MSIPDTQKAWVSTKKGPPEVALKLEKSWPVIKTLKSGEVLVKIHAGALNPVGYKVMTMFPALLFGRPYVPEQDFAGVIVDENDTDFKKGDEVFGFIPVSYQRVRKVGALSEYAIARSIDVALRPSNVDIIGASGVTLTAMTALQMLDRAQLEEGQTILVNGASTAVGGFAIQLAKIRGAKVVAVASGKNEEYVRGLGADEFIDYTTVGPLHKHLIANPPAVKYNVILEAVGIFDPSLYTFSNEYLAPNGSFVSVGGQPKLNKSLVWDSLRTLTIWMPSFLTGYKPSFHVLLTKSSRDELNLIRKYLEEGKLRPIVDSVYEFEDALKAYQRIMSSRATGKVVVKVAFGG